MTETPNRGDARGGPKGSRPANPAGSARRPPDPAARLLHRLILSWLALAWERCWRELWAPAAVAVLFAAAALSGLMPRLGGWGHSVLLGIFALAFLITAIRAVRRIRLPGLDAARRRLERTNNLDDRPLETLADRPSDDSRQARALWALHRRRAAERIAGLVVGAPHPRIAGRDPRALRLGALVLFGAALLSAGPQAGERLARALAPDFTDRARLARTAVDAWLTPPDYTGLAPLFLDRIGVRRTAQAGAGGADMGLDADAALDGEDAASGAPIPVPAGSTLTVQVANAPEPPRLIGPSGEAIAFESFGADARRLERPVETDGRYRLTVAGETLAEWDIRAKADRAPTIEIVEPPVTTPQLSLRFTYGGRDDYGIDRVTARFRRVDGPAGDAEVLEIELPAPDPERPGEPISSYRDLTAHPWAGGEVSMVLEAEDAVGQTGESGEITLTLPQRVFQHPVAQAIVDFRRQLAWAPAGNRAAVRDGLEALAWQPKAYGSDPTVFLSLSLAMRRLALDGRGRAPSDARIDALIQQLWETALHLEDGGTSLALEKLRAAERALREALERDAPMAELERLMDELQKAMNDYMQAMAEQLRDMQENSEELPQIGQEAQNTIRPQDLNDMMNQIREMMRNGMKDAAQQMLSRLQQMMENMRAGVMPQMSPQGQEAMQMMKDLQDVMKGQQELMDRTYRQSQGGEGRRGDMDQLPSENQQGRQGQNGESLGGNVPSPDARLQDSLRRQLGDVMRRFGEMMGDIPQSFGNAEGQMRRSGEALEQGRPGDAVGPQGRALDQLEAAAEAAREAFMERFSEQMGMGEQMRGEGGQESMDPLGRKPSSTYRGAAEGQVTVPDGGDIQRAREIRDELRRRAGDRARPDTELDYIDRLLDQFR